MALPVFWEKLSEGGETLESGWLKDNYGISGQIVMQKLDIKRLKAAFDGRD